MSTATYRDTRQVAKWLEARGITFEISPRGDRVWVMPELGDDFVISVGDSVVSTESGEASKVAEQ